LLKRPTCIVYSPDFHGAGVIAGIFGGGGSPSAILV